MLLAPAPRASGSWHEHDLSLADGAAALLGRTDGRWLAPHGPRGIQVNAPREAIPIADAQLNTFNEQARLCQDPVFAWLIRPALIGLAGHANERPLLERTTSIGATPDCRSSWMQQRRDRQLT